MTSRATLPDQRRRMESPRADRAEIERATALLFDLGDVVEVRIPKTRAGVVAGYFDNFFTMAGAICQADAKYRAGGVYYVLNKINPTLLGRAYNRLKEHAEHTTSDNNILGRRWFPVDLDPVRPAGISSSDGEHVEAIHRARTIAGDMAGEWDWPIIADSGTRIRTTYPGAGMTWTGTTGGNDRPRSDNPDSQLPKPSVSTADITTLSCFGQQ
jgi:hypothetical protein